MDDVKLCPVCKGGFPDECGECCKCGGTGMIEEDREATGTGWGCGPRLHPDHDHQDCV